MINQGIKSIITIREYPLPKRYFESWEKKKIDNTEIIIDYLYIKVDNHDAPDSDVLIKTIDYMDRHIKENKPVLIHCNAGRGRTGVLVIGYLMKEQKIPMEVALKRIKQIRKKIPYRDIQQEVLKKYELYLKDHQ